MTKKQFFSLFIIAITISISIIFGVFYYQKTNDTSYAEEEQKFLQQPSYPNEEECRIANGGKYNNCICAYLNYDPPASKTVEEACGKNVKMICRLKPSGYFGRADNQRPFKIATIVFAITLIITILLRKSLGRKVFWTTVTGSFGISLQLNSWLSGSMGCGRAIKNSKFLLSPGELFNVGGANCNEADIFSVVFLFVLIFIIFSLLGIPIGWIIKKIAPNNFNQEG